MKSFFSNLEDRVREVDSLLCVGLDPHTDDLPEVTGDAAKEFCISIINATFDLAAAFKPNIAFFEYLGPSGIAALMEVIASIPDGIPVILDSKRGDIASTALAYARAAFETLGADAVTVNPYLGREAIAPFISNPEFGAFILCKTSNPGAADLQDLLVVEERTLDGNNKIAKQQSKDQLFIHVAKLTQSWNEKGNLGLVVGATKPEALRAVRKAAPDLWILAPGVGAQGGDLTAALQGGLRSDGLGMLIPVSRGISRAKDPRDAAIKIRNNINQERHFKEQNQANSAIAAGLLQAGCIKFGSFTLKSGIDSPIYIDLRRLVGYPYLLSQIARAYAEILDQLQFEQLAALPYAALPITSAISQYKGWPMVYPRKESKSYGTMAQIEGVFEAGQTVVVIDDLISTGGSKIEGIEKLESAGLVVKDIVVLIDRSKDGAKAVTDRGYNLHAVVTINDLLSYYESGGKIDRLKIEEAKDFLGIR